MADCTTIDSLNLEEFYPSAFFDIKRIENNDKEISIFMKSITHTCKCGKCGAETKRYHGTYTRTIQDLPILGKKTMLYITAHEYKCPNNQCDVKTIVEKYDEFIGYYGRFTDRCEDFIETLALETSCEGASRICAKIGIQVSGDTIIRILKKRFDNIQIEPTESFIGIDDFSTRKGKKYCTVVCNGTTHTPIAILDGRDGASFREWLQANKHIKTITRDRASSYAKVINEELPDAMQIADRFHLHQNLMEVVKKALNSNVPKTFKIEIVTENIDDAGSAEQSEKKIPCKKNH